MIETIENKYDGVLIDNTTIPQKKDEFKKEIERLIEFLKNRKLPTMAQLDVDSDAYLCGICDLVGELVRKAMNAVLDDDNKTADEIRNFVSNLYAELILFDFRNTPARRFKEVDQASLYSQVMKNQI